MTVKRRESRDTQMTTEKAPPKTHLLEKHLCGERIAKTEKVQRRKRNAEIARYVNTDTSARRNTLHIVPRNAGLFVTQRFDRIQRRRFSRRVVAEKDSHCRGEDHRTDDRHHRYKCGPSEHRRYRER